MKKRVISYLIAVTMILSLLLSSVSCDMSAFEQILAAPTEDELASIVDTTAPSSNDGETDVVTDAESEIITVAPTTENVEETSFLANEETSIIFDTETEVSTSTPSFTEELEATTVFEEIELPKETEVISSEITTEIVTDLETMPPVWQTATETASPIIPEETETCTETYPENTTNSSRPERPTANDTDQVEYPDTTEAIEYPKDTDDVVYPEDTYLPDETENIVYPEDTYHPENPDEEESYTEGTLPEEYETTPTPDIPLDPVPDTPGLTYKDREFFIVSTKERTNIFYVHGAEGEYNVLSDSLIIRNNRIKDTYGFEVINKFVDTASDMNDIIDKSFLAGEQSVQAFVSSSGYGISNYVTQDKLFDLNNLGISLSTNYWNLDMMESISVNGKIYAGFGDMLATDTDIVIFNKDIADEYYVSDMYSFVYEGRWTLDNFYNEMKKVYYIDLNGNREIDESDRFALTGNYALTLDSFVYSSGLKLVDRNSYTETLSLVDEHQLYEVYHFVANILQDPSLSYGTNSSENIFTSGRALFEVINTSNIGNYAKADFSFGILPYPKLNEDQYKYTSLYKGGYICVPSNIEDPKFVGYALDIINRYSSDMESTLWMRICSSAEDLEMIGVIRNGLVSDYANAILKQELSSLVNLFGTTMYSSRTIQMEFNVNKDSWIGVIDSVGY